MRFLPKSLAALAALTLLGLLGAPGRAADSDGIEFFENRIRPVLVEKCSACHIAASEKPQGGLMLDSHEGMMRGGTRGSAVNPAEPERSWLLRAVLQENADLKMPPTGKLSDEEIHDIEAWIKMGTPDPRHAPTKSPGSGERRSI